MRPAVLILPLVALTCLALPASAAPSFTGIGIPAGASTSVATNVSADGSTVVGFVNHGGGAGDDEALRWRQATGIQLLGFLAGAASGNSVASDVSADGSVIVGTSTSGPNTLNQAFRWVGGVMEPLGTLVPNRGSMGHAVSDDGSTVAGASAMTSSSSQSDEAFRWTAGDGMVGLGHLADPPAFLHSDARGVSGNGTVIVGQSHSSDGVPEAFRWTQGGGLVGLGDLPGGTFFSSATAITPDGSVIVGIGRSEGGYEAMRWTESTGMVPLGRLDPGDSAASDVSADGTVIVGSSNAVAVIWDEANGMRDLKGVLVNDFGLDLSGWSLHEALGVSDDGRTIVGMGRNPQGKSEGWIAVIPEPSTALLLASGLLALATFHRRQSGCGITAANATGTIV